MDTAAATQVRLTGWGRATASTATLLRMHDASEVASLLRCAESSPVLARGLGRSYGDAAQNRGGRVVAPLAPDAPIELDTDARTVRASAGTSIERLMRHLLPRGWRLPVMPGTRHVTIGGAIAADVHGKNHHADGSFGAWVRELTLVDGAGDVRVLSPAGDADAFWATVGGMGLTGVVTDAVVAVEPVVSTLVDVRTSKHDTLASVCDAMEASTARYHVAWVDASRGRGFGRSVLDEGEHRQVPDSEMSFAPRRPLPAPVLPVNVVRPATIRAFNELWWRRARAGKSTVSTTKFFHPLDGVADWHRVYGRRGLLQWQIAVPMSARDVVEDSLRRLSEAGAVPALVVLKRFGASTPAPLSFPMPGWTLAVDVAAGHPRLLALLDELDERVRDAGGRLYLAKDARASAATIAAMYPRLPEWRAVRDRLDPQRRLRSDLADRLELLG